MFLMPRPQISGYFWIRNFFFPDTASVHTYLVNPQYESATFWIRSPEWKFLNTLWIQNRVDAKSGYFFIRRRNKIEPRAQLFKGRLALNPGFFKFLELKSIFSDNFLCYFQSFQSSTFGQKRIKTEMLFKLSNLNSNLALTLGYLNPALNNSAQFSEQDANFARFRTHESDANFPRGVPGSREIADKCWIRVDVESESESESGMKKLRIENIRIRGLKVFPVFRCFRWKTKLR